METKKAFIDLWETIKYVIDTKLGEHYPELAHTELRTRYSRTFPLRSTILYGWGVNPNIVKSNTFFERVTGYTPIELALARHNGHVRESVVDGIIIINDLKMSQLTGINSVNFTYLTKVDYDPRNYNAVDKFILRCKSYVNYGRTDQ